MTTGTYDHIPPLMGPESLQHVWYCYDQARQYYYIRIYLYVGDIHDGADICPSVSSDCTIVNFCATGSL